MADILSEDELDALLTQMKPDDDEEGEDGRAAGVPNPGSSPEPVAAGLDLSDTATTTGPDKISQENLGMILALPVQARVEIGRTRLPVGEILNLCQGAVLELDHLASDLLDLVVNNQVVARGEAVVVNENFGVRVLNVDSVEARIRKL